MGRYKDYDRGPKRGDYDDSGGSYGESGGRPSCQGSRTSPEPRPASSSQVLGPTTEIVGTVKMYKTDKGFGFVGQDCGGKDIFVHATALARAGLSGLITGQRVRMQIGEGQKGLEAKTIESLD